MEETLWGIYPYPQVTSVSLDKEFPVICVKKEHNF